MEHMDGPHTLRMNVHRSSHAGQLRSWRTKTTSRTLIDPSGVATYRPPFRFAGKDCRYYPKSMPAKKQTIKRNVDSIAWPPIRREIRRSRPRLRKRARWSRPARRPAWPTRTQRLGLWPGGHPHRHGQFDRPGRGHAQRDGPVPDRRRGCRRSDRSGERHGQYRRARPERRKLPDYRELFQRYRWTSPAAAVRAC